MYVVSYFVDTADPETERSTLDTGAVHVITNQKNQLFSYCQWGCYERVDITYTQELLKVGCL